MGRRWGRLRRILIVEFVAAAIDVSLGLLTDDWPFGVLVVLIVLVAVVNIVRSWFESRVARHSGDDPPPPSPPALPAWLVDRPEEAQRVVGAVLARRAGAVGITTGLHGAGGFGKTTLAQVVANDRRVRRRFGNRVYMITVGQDVKGPAQVARLVNQTVALITGEMPAFTDPQLAGDHLAQVLDERPPTLLIIDDVWEREQLEPFLRGGKRCVRLVTTRITDLLPAGARSVLVDTMSEDQARALLTWDLGGTIAAPLQTALLRITGGWALLLRLVNRAIAARIATGASPDEAARTVHDAILADPAWVDPDRPFDVADPRSRAGAVSATINASARFLTPEQRQRLAELGIFAEDESIPVDLVARVWRATSGLSLDDSRMLCHELRRLALVTVVTDETGAKVRLHDAVRAYLRAQLGPRLPAVHAAFVAELAAGLPAATPLDESIPAPAVAWWELGDNERYLDDHLPEHLAAAGLDAQRDALVTDLRWIGRRLCRYGPSAAAADAERADTDLARNLSIVLGQTAHLLAPTEPPESVVDILFSRLRDDPRWTAAVDNPDAASHRPRLTAAWPLPDRADPALRRVLTGHAGRVLAVAWSPDGTRLATAGDYRTVRIWDVATGTAQASLTRHTGSVRAVAWSPDGTRLATAGDDMVRIWNVATGTVPAILTAHAGSVLAMAWLPGGTRLATTGGYHDDRMVRVWDVATGTVQASLTGHAGSVLAVAWSPDGTRLATAGDDRTVRIWDVVTGTVQARLTGHAGSVLAVAWSPDGTRLATGGHDMVGIWDDVATSTVPAILSGHTGPVRAVAWSPDGTRLATGGDDRTVRIWDPITASVQATATLAARAAAVRAVAWSPDGARLATAGDDRTVQIWDPIAASVQATAFLTGSVGSVRAVAWSPDGARLATGGHDMVVIWDVVTRKIPAILTGPAGRVRAVAWSPDGARLAAGGHDMVVIWDVVTRKVQAILTGYTGSVRAVAWSPDGTRLATGGDDRTVRIWDVVTRKVQAILTGHTDWVGAVAWSPDGTRLATGGDDRTVRIWDVVTGTVQAFLTGYTGSVRAVAWSPDGARLATAGDDRTLRVWSPTNGECKATMRVEAQLYHCAWSPIDGRIAFGGAGGIYVFAYCE